MMTKVLSDSELNNFYAISYDQGGVFIKVNSPETCDKTLLLNNILLKIEKKKIKNVDKKILQQAIEESKNILVKIAEPQQEYKANADATLFISKDKMSASIQLTPPDGGMPLSKQELYKLIRDKGIIYGLDESIINSLSENPKYNEYIDIAHGTLPQKGEDGKIEFLVDIQLLKKPTINEDGSVNYHELNAVSSIRKDQKIANIIPPKNGIPGKNILGQTIPALNGKPFNISRGKNIEITNNSIVAAIDGQISYVDRKISILTSYDVEGNIDVSTGNIHFPGNVTIRGNVLTDFEVEAGGNVEVYGVVEGAKITTAGDIILHRGILGAHKGILKSGGDIVAKYIENSDVSAKNSIKCEAVMHSKVKCNILEVSGKKGLIVGGEVKAGSEVAAKIIGSPMNTLTSIEVGISPEERETYRSKKEAMIKIEADLKKTSQTIGYFLQLQTKGQLLQDRQITLNSLYKAKVQLSQQYEELKGQIRELEEKISSSISGKVKASNVVYSGIHITIGNVSRTIKENLENITFYVEGAEIKDMPCV